MPCSQDSGTAMPASSIACAMLWPDGTAKVLPLRRASTVKASPTTLTSAAKYSQWMLAPAQPCACAPAMIQSMKPFGPQT